MIQKGRQEVYSILIAELGIEQANQTIDELVKAYDLEIMQWIVMKHF